MSSTEYGDSVTRLALCYPRPLGLALAALAAADRPNVLARHHRRPGVRRPRLPRQPGHQDAEPRRLRQAVGVAEELLRLPGLLADAVVPADRAVQLPHRRRGHVHRPVDDAAGRADARRVRSPTAGYRTGLFGKWHLGDNYPLRPEDRGFQETLWHQGGGLAQPTDPPGHGPKTAYFDPILKQNGKEVKTKGYCTDVFTDAARDVHHGRDRRSRSSPTSRTTPRTARTRCRTSCVAPYRKLDLTPAGFPKVGQPWATKKLNATRSPGPTAMIENIDTNFGRLLKALDDKKLAENTIVDLPDRQRPRRGAVQRRAAEPQGDRLRGRHPRAVLRPLAGAGQAAARVVDTPLAHIDVTPTLLDAVRGAMPARRHVRRPQLPPAAHRRHGELAGPDAVLPVAPRRRAGEVPGVRRPRPAVQARAGGRRPAGGEVDSRSTSCSTSPTDPFEQKDLAAEKPDEVAKLKKEYEAWFAT